jgi:hypothetical protein
MLGHVVTYEKATEDDKCYDWFMLSTTVDLLQ